MKHKILYGVGGALGLFLLLGLYYFFSYNVPKPLYGTTLLDEKGEVFYHFLNEREEWHMEGRGEISPKLKKAVIAYEDRRFESHYGVDVYALGRAFFKNMTQKKRSGASTITMQLAKGLEPKKRSYLNKYKEIWEALRLEQNYSKKEILQLYLNNSPYGGNIRGYETAARMYFRKKSKDLSWAQAALLAILPNAPGKMHVEKNREILKKKRDRLLKILLEKKEMTEEEYRFAVREGLPERRYSLNQHAYHFSKKLQRKHKGEVIESTLSSFIQKKIERMARDYQKQLENLKIQDVAVLVIENKTASIKAYYGSSSYWDMLEQRRSPGSTLKPFLYALGIEEGLLLPQSLYPDVPSFFGNFSPTNADGVFHGMVPMEEALQNSYNLPFVYLLQDYGSNRFFYFLQSHLGKKTWKNKAGLSLILGSEEISALDLAYFYTALANQGKGKELVFLKQELNATRGKKTKKVFEEGSSLLTEESLEKVMAPKEYQSYQKKEKIAWKTGTSFGRKDAWACGFNKDWTLIVWVGNIDNRGNENIQGIETAGRLFFRIFQELPRKFTEKETTEGKMEKEGKNIFREVKIDEKTGYRWVEGQNIEWKEVKAPKYGKLIRQSPYWKKIFVNKKGEEIDSRNADFTKRKEKYILDYPDEVKKFYHSQEVYGEPLKILYPKEQLHIYLPRDLQGQNQMLAQLSNPKGGNLYWYLNGKYLGSGKEEERSFFLYPGFYQLTVVSESAESTQVNFTVENQK